MPPADSQNSIQSRDLRFDILKVLGLFCIILAHVHPPSIIFQLRNFDVPLMVIISGSVFYLSFRKKDLPFRRYFQKRVIRLVAPVWIFLIMFFVLIGVLFAAVKEPYPFACSTIFETFLLSGGVESANGSAGFVYIIRVFVLTALVSPYILSLYKKLNHETLFLALLTIFYIFYELLLKFIDTIQFSLPGLENLLKNYLLLSIPYGCLIGLGIVFTQAKKEFLVKIALFSLGIFLACMGYFLQTSGKLLTTQIAKYPPTLYYLSYAIFVSTLTYLIVDHVLEKYGNHFLAKFERWIHMIVFISQSSLWIYLWQSFWVIFWGLVPAHYVPWANHFVVFFVGVASLSILTTYWQKRFFTKMIQTTSLGQKYPQIATILFLQ
ncbi:MAG: acyltransferase [Scytolyngbya sp. HA4215-MV1]|jgi:hypothetical protein|nr:acyltransferase [Scytolyngbya sp. HA4215-MV1]